MGKTRKSITFQSAIKLFMRDYNIPTKKDVDRLMAKLDRLEELIRSMPGSGVRRPYKKGGRATATDRVLSVIQEFEQGVAFAVIKDRMEFEEKKLRNILYRLKKTGRIRQLRRGVYAPILDSESKSNQ